MRVGYTPKGVDLLICFYIVNLLHQLSPSALRTTIGLGLLVHRRFVLYRSFEGRSVAGVFAGICEHQPSPFER